MSTQILPPLLPDISGKRSVVGITTTAPVEVLFNAGCVPIDMNNLFVTSPEAEELIKSAERRGFPRTCCSWTKGIYGAARRYGIKKMVVIVQGDCSNAHALAEMLEYEGGSCIPFAFPYRQSVEDMENELRGFARRFATDLSGAEEWRRRLVGARDLAHRIDTLSWRDQKVHGIENHLWLVSSSDFCGDIDRYREEAGLFFEKAKERQSIDCRARLGMVGVPTIVPEIYDFLESRGGLVVYNETQRQFSMPGEHENLAGQYTSYTYPYGIRCRLQDIRREVERRSLDGIIHYVQSFCYHRIEDRMLREGVSVPVITVEQDSPGILSGQIKTRLEAFVELLWAGKSGHRIF